MIEEGEEEAHAPKAATAAARKSPGTKAKSKPAGSSKLTLLSWPADKPKRTGLGPKARAYAKLAASPKPTPKRRGPPPGPRATPPAKRAVPAPPTSLALPATTTTTAGVAQQRSAGPASGTAATEPTPAPAAMAQQAILEPAPNMAGAALASWVDDVSSVLQATPGLQDRHAVAFLSAYVNLPAAQMIQRRELQRLHGSGRHDLVKEWVWAALGAR